MTLIRFRNIITVGALSACGFFSPSVFAQHALVDPYKVTNGGDTALYHETFRPQYHFTPAHRWIGDPCGLVRYDGKYRAYSWGAAESDDLVHWTEINRDAIKGLPDRTSPFTGSVVVDTDNTAGYGENALIAVFTSYDEDSRKQSQSIAFSLDGGDTFNYYDRNPVIDIWSTEFRDPTVIRYVPTGKWIMSVAKALEKKVAFYESENLKDWKWISDFGPMGDNEKSWECPDLFQVNVEETGETKWVLLVSVNWAREQYFVGDFDGKEFKPDKPYSEPLYVDDGLDYYASRTFQDYDSDRGEVLSLGWINTWDYAQQAPSRWGKGIWSIPRSLSLYTTPDGLRLRQKPFAGLSSLRSGNYRYHRKISAGTISLPAIGDMNNQYEMRLILAALEDDTAGLNICCGDGRKVSISYDPASGYVTIGRLNSTAEDLPKFSRMACSKVTEGKGAPLDLDIFVDKSSVEIFVENGRKVMTLLTYAAPGQCGVEIFSQKGKADFNIEAWKIDSIWH
ncbi:MAG: glycoside hydrolase family 32 protein [Muribaculaceae bacterium]|nr:glycoside hydrolase family 32 protein [Muribaculaceae bacterium]